LTPFIENAKEIASWLGGSNSDDISMSIDWQPNDRAIGIISAEKSIPNCTSNCKFNLKFHSIHTNKSSISVDNEISILDNNDTYTYKRVISNRYWDDKMYLFPIPDSEIRKNPNLIQNPGW
jgi:hypothetical protein